MAKPRRNVQFQHRGNNGHDQRRMSMSEVSEEASEPGSPTKGAMNGKEEVGTEDVRPSRSQETVLSSRAEAGEAH